jgi:ATP-dependent exoDNAse (exonuclease V) alpha subunit
MKKKILPLEELRGRYMLDVLNEITLNGDAYVSSEQLYTACKRQRKALSWDAFSSDKAYLLREAYLHQEGRRLYLTKTWRYEMAAAEAIADILRANRLEGPDLPETVEAAGLIMSAEQKEAVSMALSHRLTLILGGGGTGKSTLSKALVKHRAKGLSNFVLCAPTGKAARNLTERKEYICQEGAKRYLAGEHVQVLSPFNSLGQLCVHELNQKLRTLVNPPSKTSGKLAHSGVTFHDGDRVMITENDWERRICNGDIGTFHVLSQEDNSPNYGVNCGTRTALWQDWKGFKNLMLAYCISVHKSQGSEYDTVILPLTKQFSSLLNRNLIYTAISRAKREVILVGDADALDMALQRHPAERKSMLVSKTRMLMRQSA